MCLFLGIPELEQRLTVVSMFFEQAKDERCMFIFETYAQIAGTKLKYCVLVECLTEVERQ